jgi:nucleotide-binding universal stress UspA family protein
MNVLIPVQYPLTTTNKRAIQHGMELIQGTDNPELMIFHLNELQSGPGASRKRLREAVETEFGDVDASYVVRDGFLTEEAIIETALHYDMDWIVLSEGRRNRWRRLFEEFLAIDHDPERMIKELAGIEVDVVTDSGIENSTRS